MVSLCHQCLPAFMTDIHQHVERKCQSGHLVSSFLLKVAMLERIDKQEVRERPITVGRTSSQCRQYSRKAFKHHRPCIMMTNGSTPNRRRCFVPLIRNKCPDMQSSPSSAQISLHRSRNHFHVIGAWDLDSILKANSGALLRMFELHNGEVILES